MDTTYDMNIDTRTTPWSAVICMMLTSFTLVAMEFMPVSLLTPIADELAITAGQAGQAISISGFFAVFTALFSNLVLGSFDRRLVVLGYTVVLVISGLRIASSSCRRQLLDCRRLDDLWREYLPARLFF